jgi:hypothetical protein
MRMRPLVALLLAALLPGCASGKPEDLRWRPSNDKQYEVAVRYRPLHEGSATGAKLLLRRARAEKITGSVDLDLDLAAEDDRNGITVEWSPDSRSLAATIEAGQLRTFSIYRVDSGHLKLLPELPLADELQPEHSKSRGGPAFQEWIDGSHFKVFDSSSQTEFTYEITKDGKLRATHAKPLD